MTNNYDAFTKYKLPATHFSEEQFSRTWGDTLYASGHDDIATLISTEGMRRVFLRERLSEAAMTDINNQEGLLAAKSAENFQQEVALTKIVDNYEPLVNLRTLSAQQHFQWSFTDARYHPACGEWANKEKLFLVRQQVANKLIKLTGILSELNLGIHFEDGFRPLGVQEGLFQRRIAMAKQAHPNWSDDELLLEAKSKTAYTARFAAHKAGAAVDIRLISSESGGLLDIGHGYPDGGEIVRLDTPYVTQEQWQNRKLLEYSAQKSGLSMYPFEDWHLCSGDATAAVVEKPGGPYIATYGPVKQFDTATGEVLETYTNDELDVTFPMEVIS